MWKNENTLHVFGGLLVNPVLNIIWVDSLRLGGLHLVTLIIFFCNIYTVKNRFSQTTRLNDQSILTKLHSIYTKFDHVEFEFVCVEAIATRFQINFNNFLLRLYIF